MKNDPWPTHSLYIDDSKYLIGCKDVIVNRSACSNRPEMDSLIYCFLNTVRSTVLNRPWLNMYLSSKPLQLIGEFCMKHAPYTTITNDGSYIKRQKSKMIFKSMSHHRSYATIMDSNDCSVDTLCHCPVMFQEFIDNEKNSKYHVIGETVYESIYMSRSDDYRKDYGSKGSELSEFAGEVAIKQHHVGRVIGTEYYDFDMRGDHFMELNPSPAVSEFDNKDGIMLDRLIDYILSKQSN